MSLTSRMRHRRLAKLTAGPAVALLLAALTGCGSSGTSTGSPGTARASDTVLAGKSCDSSKATKLTFWAWVPGMNRAVEEFNKTHPTICVTLENPGAGVDEYVILNNTMKAGSGAPDVAEVEFAELPSFEVLHYLVDLSKYGLGSERSKFVPWAWQQVTQGSAIYAMPSDFGPAAFYYNAPLLAKHHITPPATWPDFANAALKLHKADPSATLINFAPDDLQWLLDMMAQANASPFGYTGGDSLSINWIGPAQLRFAGYWQNLINAHAVTTINTANTRIPTNLDKGVIAAAIDSAWAPSYFAPNAKKTLGDWRAAPLPQWTPGARVEMDWGGSTYPVFAQSKHPAEAAQFVRWLTATDAAWNIVKTPPSSLFPAYVPLLDSEEFKNITYPVSGSSHPNQVFAAAADHLAPIQWPPFMPAAISQALTTFGSVVNGKQTLAQAFQTFQDQMVKYARAQGFKVTTS
ncbi:MAG TPA: extracellular solute-binding protein [Actinoallomurus sp.]|nr:extracellular solute-binding protein [Actinoallomurus sp.]